MRFILDPITWLCAAVVLLTGCSDAQFQSALPGAGASDPAATQDAVRPTRSLPRDLLYVSGGDDTPGWVTIYPQRGSDQNKIGAITKGIDAPWCDALDDNENLYVGNVANSTVTVYARGGATPFETLTDAGDPVGITVGHDGTVYVANFGTGAPPSGGSILAYHKGETTPYQTIPIANGSYPIGLALDSSGNLFATVNHYHEQREIYEGAVYEFAPGSSKGKKLGLQGLVRRLNGIAMDKHDDLLVVDEQKNKYYILVFPPGKTLPSQKISINSFQAPYGIAINRENTEFWLTSGFGGEVRGFSYPGGKLLDVIAHRRGYALGVAISPRSDF